MQDRVHGEDPECERIDVAVRVLPRQEDLPFGFYAKGVVLPALLAVLLSFYPVLLSLQQDNRGDQRRVLKGATVAKKKQVNLSVGRGEKLPVSQGAGLTAKGRAKHNRETGSNLKAPTKDKDNPRHISFCARSQQWAGERGKAARKRWGCS